MISACSKIDIFQGPLDSLQNATWHGSIRFIWRRYDVVWSSIYVQRIPRKMRLLRLFLLYNFMIFLKLIRMLLIDMRERERKKRRINVVWRPLSLHWFYFCIFNFSFRYFAPFSYRSISSYLIHSFHIVNKTTYKNIRTCWFIFSLCLRNQFKICFFFFKRKSYLVFTHIFACTLSLRTCKTTVILGRKFFNAKIEGWGSKVFKTKVQGVAENIGIVKRVRFN